MSKRDDWSHVPNEVNDILAQYWRRRDPLAELLYRERMKRAMYDEMAQAKERILGNVDATRDE